MKTIFSFCWVNMMIFLMVGGIQAQNYTSVQLQDSGLRMERAEEVPVNESRHADEDISKANKRVFGKSSEDSYAGKVVVIKVGMEELSSVPRYKFIRRTVRRADDEGAMAIIFDLNTPGGFAWETSEFLMQDLAKIKTRTISYVNPNAVSAGAIVALGTDVIYMAPASAIGAAGVVTQGQEMGKMERAKAESYLVAAVRGVAKKKGHDPDLASAMMKMEFVYEKGDIYVDEENLLTLNAEQATMEFEGQPLLAKSIAYDLDDVLEKEQLGERMIVVAEPSGMEKFAFLAAGFSGILILVGIGGAYLEMKTPGFGIGGAISLVAFSLFFFGNYAAGNMAGYGLMLLFVLGVILIAVELFIFPGVLVPGVLGAVLIMGTLFMAMVDDFAFDDNGVRGWDSDQAWDFIMRPAINLAIGLLGSVALSLLMMRYLPDVPLFNKMVMKGSLDSGNSSNITESEGTRVGLQGSAITDLRPVGKGDFDGKVLEITAANGFVPSGTEVKITSEDGLRLLVEEV